LITNAADDLPKDVRSIRNAESVTRSFIRTAALPCPAMRDFRTRDSFCKKAYAALKRAITATDTYCHAKKIRLGERQLSS